jgi:hypothetical protein
MDDRKLTGEGAPKAPEEIALLMRRWEVKAGDGAVVLIGGEPGNREIAPRAAAHRVAEGAYLDLDFRVTEKRRSDKVLDTLKKEYRRTSTAHRGQHKTQRGVGVFVVVDIDNFLRSSKTFHQSRELPPVAQTVDFESH